VIIAKDAIVFRLCKIVVLRIENNCCWTTLVRMLLGCDAWLLE